MMKAEGGLRGGKLRRERRKERRATREYREEFRKWDSGALRGDLSFQRGWGLQGVGGGQRVIGALMGRELRPRKR